MKVKVLGCSGSIGGPKYRTTALLVDADILIDCGTGVGELGLDELTRIDHLFLTHSHLDHTAFLPLLIDAVWDARDRPLQVYALPETIEVLRTHIFNWAVWPDFSEIPSVESSFLRFVPVAVGDVIDLAGRRLVVLPARHTVPAVGYGVDSGQASLAFTGDTEPCSELWAAVNAMENLRHVLVETAFSDRDLRRAHVSMHLTPARLAESLRQLMHPVNIYVTHLKSGQDELTMLELHEQFGDAVPRRLEPGQVFEL